MSIHLNKQFDNFESVKIPFFYFCCLFVKKLCLTIASGHLTRIHPDFVHLCLLAHHHHYALPILDDFVWQFDDKLAEANVEGFVVELKRRRNYYLFLLILDVLKYLYFGGMAYCGMRDFVNARRWFENVKKIIKLR